MRDKDVNSKTAETNRLLERGVRVAIELVYRQRDATLPYSDAWKALSLAVTALEQRAERFYQHSVPMVYGKAELPCTE